MRNGVFFVDWQPCRVEMVFFLFVCGQTCLRASCQLEPTARGRRKRVSDESGLRVEAPSFFFTFVGSNGSSCTALRCCLAVSPLLLLRSTDQGKKGGDGQEVARVVLTLWGHCLVHPS